MTTNVPFLELIDGLKGFPKTDKPIRCQRCHHWHPPLMPCGSVPTLPPRDLMFAVFDLACELAAAKQLLAQLQVEIEVIREGRAMADAEREEQTPLDFSDVSARDERVVREPNPKQIERITEREEAPTPMDRRTSSLADSIEKRVRKGL